MATTKNLIKYHEVKDLICGEYIRLHLNSLELSQKELSDCLGISKHTLNNLIHERIKLSTGRKLSIFYVIKDLYRNRNNNKNN